VVTGKFDPILNALLNNEFGLLELMIKEVAKVSDALSTETFVVYKNYDMKIPYIL
jgi:Lrp/AsnC family transcriptional regulator for asnA, asnC and gidA